MVICQQIGNLEEMKIFLETYNLPKLDLGEIDNLNRPITSFAIKSAIKKHQTKVQGQIASQENSTKYMKKS